MRDVVRLVVLAWLGACGGGPGGGPADAGSPRPDATPAADAGPIAAVARFAPPAPGAGAAWDALPFPSDLFLDGAGRLALTSLPVGPNAAPDHVAMMIDTLRTMNGAGVWSIVTFPIEGAVDPSTLAGQVRLVDLDGGLTDVPVDVVWREDLGAVVAAPRLGVMLREGRRYAAWITTDVRSAGGLPLSRAPAFAEAVDLGATPEDPAVAAAQAHLRPLVEALDPALRARLAAATVFRTEDVTRDARAMRDVVAAAPPTIVSIDELWGPAAAELDQLFGVQDPGAPPGYDETAARPQPHGHVAAVVHGTLDLPSFIATTPTGAGFLQLDADGAPIVKGRHPVRFTLVLPKAASYADLPVVLFVHGVNAARVNMLVMADTAAAHGLALLAIDLLHHGDRAIGARDLRNDTTGEMAPDGFGDRIGLAAGVNFFHLADRDGVPAYHPRAMRENLRQAAIDVVSLVQFARTADPAPLNAALVAAGLPADVAFRADRIGLLTLSFGAMLSTVALAIEPELDAAVMAVAASGMPFPALLHSASLSSTFIGVVTAPYDVGDRVVLGDPVRGARFDPLIALYDSALAQGEAAAFAPYVLEGGHSVLVLEAWSDEWVSNDSTEHLAGALGLPRMLMAAPEAPPSPALRYVALPEVPAPLQGNVGGAHTAALTLWHPALHSLIDYLGGWQFFEPGFPPFTMRREPLPVTNPLVEAHAQWATFLADAAAGIPPRVIDPFAAP